MSTTANPRPPWMPKPMSEDAYYGLAGEFVKATEPYTEAASESMLVQFLVAYGNAVGPAAHYLVEDTFHPARLFALIVAPTAEGAKGTSWNRVVTAFKRADETGWMDRVTSGLTSGAGLIVAATPDEVSKEVVALLDQYGIDATGDDDKRLFVLETEFAGTLSVMQRPGNDLSPVIRQAWDDGDLSTMTVKPREVRGAHISIVGHTTPEDLLQNMPQTDMVNGFGNRFLFVAAYAARDAPMGESVPSDVMRPIVSRLNEAIKHGREAKRLQFSPDAEALWKERFSGLKKVPPGLIGSLLSRGKAQVPRIALAYALLDKSEVIELEHLLAAYAIWDYSKASVKAIFPQEESTGNRHADKIVAALRRAGSDGLTRSEISTDVLSGNKSAKEIDRLCALLKHQDYIQIKPRTKGEGGGERWRLKRDKR